MIHLLSFNKYLLPYRKPVPVASGACGTQSYGSASGKPSESQNKDMAFPEKKQMEAW